MLVKLATFNAALEAGRFCRKSDPDPLALRRALVGSDHPLLSNAAAQLTLLDADIVLLNEFDYIADVSAGIEAFNHQYLPNPYPYCYVAPVNTGVKVGKSGENHGFGRFPGQYGMALLSRFPLDTTAIRTFRRFRWAALPNPNRPRLHGRFYYPDGLWQQLRLSSKSHWDIPVLIGQQRLHILASHPTPPVFDGPERRNQCRNADEIRFWCHYLDDELWIADDQRRTGGLPAGAAFVLLGDLNADPQRGDSAPGAITRLLNHPRLQSLPVPQHSGGDITSDWQKRVDYVLPSTMLKLVDNGVFWPQGDEPGSNWVSAPESSDHRPVWVTVQLPC